MPRTPSHRRRRSETTGSCMRRPDNIPSGSLMGCRRRPLRRNAGRSHTLLQRHNGKSRHHMSPPFPLRTQSTLRHPCHIARHRGRCTSAPSSSHFDMTSRCSLRRRLRCRSAPRDMACTHCPRLRMPLWCSLARSCRRCSNQSRLLGCSGRRPRDTRGLYRTRRHRDPIGPRCTSRGSNNPHHRAGCHRFGRRPLRRRPPRLCRRRWSRCKRPASSARRNCSRGRSCTASPSCCCSRWRLPDRSRRAVAVFSQPPRFIEMQRERHADCNLPAATSDRNSCEDVEAAGREARWDVRTRASPVARAPCGCAASATDAEPGRA